MNNPSALPAISKNLSKPDKSWVFSDGSKRMVVVLKSVAIGRGEYLPGWQWSKHVGAKTGPSTPLRASKKSQAHVGYVISGRMRVKDANGQEIIVGPGEAFSAGPGHDAWVKGAETCVALDFEALRKVKL